MNRLFGVRERRALYLAADGKCENCGVELPPSWHADHVVPWVAGGRTDVINGAALCARCNLAKGSRKHMAEPPRLWQLKALPLCIQTFNHKRDFLCVAFFGAGKTRHALDVGCTLLDSHAIERILVVSPTLYLKQQWRKAGEKRGINLDSDWDGSRLTPDFQGAVMTYHLAANAPLEARKLCDKSTLVIFDEIHHAAEQRTWGDSLRLAFDNHPNIYRLALSGTPFREDQNQIPFITYREEDGRKVSVPDYLYTYGEAMEQGVCRDAWFPTYDGTVSWRWGDTEFLDRRLGEETSDEEASRRLRAALAPEKNFVHSMLLEANNKLNELRAKDSRAGGLIVGIDIWHINALARQLYELTGTRPVVVTSEDGPQAAAIIEEFESGNQPWLLAVKMISEGINIDRLQVGVYLTNVRTELYFRQFFGRFVRMRPDLPEDQAAFVYVPHDPVLTEFVRRIQEERDHQIDKELNRERPRGGDGGEPPSEFEVLAATSEASDVYNRGDGYDPKVFALMESLRGQQLQPLPRPEFMKVSTEFAAILGWSLPELMQKLTGGGCAPSLIGSVKEPAFDQRKKLRAKNKKSVSRLANVLQTNYKEISTFLHDLQGVWTKQATVEQLKERRDWLEDWWRRARRESASWQEIKNSAGRPAVRE